jgi:hypothetical protein
MIEVILIGLFILIPLAMATAGLALIVNAIESVKKSLGK